MRKLITILSITLLFFGGKAMAIGLPNNAYMQRHAPQQQKLHSVNGEVKKYTLLSEAKTTYAADQSNTLDSEADIQEFSKTIIDKIVGFVSMLILSLSSFGSSVADELHVLHTWVLTDFPART